MELTSSWMGIVLALAAMPVLAGAPTLRGQASTLGEALFAPGPEPSAAPKMTLYDRILGSWDVEVHDYDIEGGPRIQHGEWHFGWVLEGRAIQDVLIVPARGLRDPAKPSGSRYGTSMRVYDPKADAWNVTWINPATGGFNRLVGRKAGDEIVQEGRRDDGPRIRWTFREITPRSFHWLGESSRDEGKTWLLEAEFFGRRRE